MISYRFLATNLFIFVSHPWKLHSRYCQIEHYLCRLNSTFGSFPSNVDKLVTQPLPPSGLRILLFRQKISKKMIQNAKWNWNPSPLNFPSWSILKCPSVEILHQGSMIPSTISFSELICLYHNVPRYVQISPFLQIKDIEKTQ